MSNTSDSERDDRRLRSQAQAEATRAHMAHDDVNSAVAEVFGLAARTGALLGIDTETDLHEQLRTAHRHLTEADAALAPQVDASDPRTPHVDAARAHITAARDALSRANDTPSP